MTTVFNHISRSAQYHNMKHASCIFICINKTESLMFSKLKLIPIVLTWRVLYPVELFLKYLVNFINPHNMGLIWLFVGPTGVYLLDFFCSGIQFNLLLSPYPCFISLLYLDLYVLGDDALIS